MLDVPLKNCHDCGVAPGQRHLHGCDMERCPRCGFQKIGCDCVYEVNGIDPMDLKETHPDIYHHGPTREMYAQWDSVWDQRRLPWTGEPAGFAECREFGWFCVWEGGGYQRCEANHPQAGPDMNRLYQTAIWNPDIGRWQQRRSGCRKHD